jgi:hypothetical protein
VDVEVIFQMYEYVITSVSLYTFLSLLVQNEIERLDLYLLIK